MGVDGLVSGFGRQAEPLILLAALMSALPLLIIATTSFVKIAIVFSLVRQALGVQSVPPNIVLYSMAAVLTVYVMLPVGIETAELVRDALDLGDELVAAVPGALGPLRDFMSLHIVEQYELFFKDTAFELWGDLRTEQLLLDAKTQPLIDLVFKMPAFILSELSRAFQIGFLVYLPFVIVDMIVANVLLALGMVTMSPITISLPIKLLLFVGISGWERLMQSLVLSYA